MLINHLIKNVKINAAELNGGWMEMTSKNNLNKPKNYLINL